MLSIWYNLEQLDFVKAFDNIRNGDHSIYKSHGSNKQNN